MTIVVDLFDYVAFLLLGFRVYQFSVNLYFWINWLCVWSFH